MTSQIQTSTKRRVPWFVTAFGAVCAALGISLAIIFGFGVNKAFAFTVDGHNYPDTLAGATVTFNETLYAPTYATGNFEPQTWYSLHLTSPSAYSGNASSWFYSEPNTVSNPWWFYVSNAQDLDSSGTNGQRYGYMGNSPNAGWWGLKSGVSSPTVTFYDVAGDDLLTNSLFIMWVVGNSDYEQRYGSESFTNWSAQASNGVIGYSYVSVQVSPIVRIYSSQNQETWTLVYSDNNLGPGIQAGSYAVVSQAYYRVDFVYTLAGQSHTESVYVGNVAPANVNLPIYVSYTYPSEQAGSIEVSFSQSGAKPDSVTLYYSPSSNGTYQQVYFTNTVRNNGGFYKAWLLPGDYGNGYYKIVAQVSNGSIEQELGYIAIDDASSTWEDMWEDAWGTLQPILKTFRDIFASLFLWIPADLRNFLLAMIILLIVLGLISRIV